MALRPQWTVAGASTRWSGDRLGPTKTSTSSSRSATPLRIDFGGEIDTVFDPEEVIAPGFGLGTAFHGFYEFDPDDAIEASPGFFLFLPPSLFLGSATIGGVTVSLPPPASGFILLLDDFEGPQGVVDAWIPLVFRDPGIFAVPSGGCGLNLIDTTASALPGGFFVPQNLEAFDVPFFSCSVVGDEFIASITGPITTWVVTPPGAAVIPEPAGFVVFAIGAGMVGLARHRRSRKN